MATAIIGSSNAEEQSFLLVSIDHVTAPAAAEPPRWSTQRVAGSARVTLAEASGYTLRHFT
jgi:hypothetical protein